MFQDILNNFDILTPLNFEILAGLTWYIGLPYFLLSNLQTHWKVVQIQIKSDAVQHNAAELPETRGIFSQSGKSILQDNEIIMYNKNKNSQGIENIYKVPTHQ